MTDERERALAAFWRVFEKRLATAPVVEHRRRDREKLIDAQRAPGPVDGEVAYWVQNANRPRA